jgi:heme/copper-type cytochrome/quinol oxidase subunit 2
MEQRVPVFVICMFVGEYMPHAMLWLLFFVFVELLLLRPFSILYRRRSNYRSYRYHEFQHKSMFKITVTPYPLIIDWEQLVKWSTDDDC